MNMYPTLSDTPSWSSAILIQCRRAFLLYCFHKPYGTLMFLFNNSLQPWRKSRSMIVLMHLYSLESICSILAIRQWSSSNRLLECSPASFLALQNHCEEKHEKFITRWINNKSPSHFSLDTCRQCQILKNIFFHLGERKIVLDEGKCLWLKGTLF